MNIDFILAFFFSSGSRLHKKRHTTFKKSRLKAGGKHERSRADHPYSRPSTSCVTKHTAIRFDDVLNSSGSNVQSSHTFDTVEVVIETRVGTKSNSLPLQNNDQSNDVHFDPETSESFGSDSTVSKIPDGDIANKQVVYIQKLFCERCPLVSFTTYEELQLHNKLVHEEIFNPVICPQCTRMYKNEQDLQEHIKEAHSSQKLFCHFCKDAFERREELVEHLRNHEAFYCKTCGKGYLMKSEYEEHCSTHKTHSKVKTFKCLGCCKSYASLHCLEKHSSKCDKVNDKIYECHLCKKILNSKYTLKEHLDGFHKLKENPDVCDSCGKVFHNRATYKQHLNTHREGSDKYKHKCPYCEKGFTQNFRLNDHIKCLHMNEKYTCEYCDRLFVCRVALTRHLVYHTGNYKYTCEKCNKGYTTKNQYRLHCNTHINHKPFLCPHCGAGYYYRSGLEHHAKTCPPNYNE